MIPTLSKSLSNAPVAIGQLALHTSIGSSLPLPYVRSYIVAGARRSHAEATFTEEYYTPRYATDGTLTGNLRFALRYEPLDMAILHAALTALGSRALTDWILSEPTSAIAIVPGSSMRCSQATFSIWLRRRQESTSML